MYPSSRAPFRCSTPARDDQAVISELGKALVGVKVLPWGHMEFCRQSIVLCGVGYVLLGCPFREGSAGEPARSIPSSVCSVVCRGPVFPPGRGREWLVKDTALMGCTGAVGMRKERGGGQAALDWMTELFPRLKAQVNWLGVQPSG